MAASTGAIVQSTSPVTNGPADEDSFTEEQPLTEMVFGFANGDLGRELTEWVEKEWEVYGNTALIIWDTSPMNRDPKLRGMTEGFTLSFTQVLTGGPKVVKTKDKLSVWGGPPWLGRRRRGTFKLGLTNITVITMSKIVNRRHQLARHHRLRHRRLLDLRRRHPRHLRPWLWKRNRHVHHFRFRL